MEIKVGERFGRLTVIEDCGPKNVKCVCDCGKTKIAHRKYLRNGDTQSCGCLHRDGMKKLFSTHGETGTRLHRIWKSMRTRATNRNRSQAKDYVLRGITICDEWSDYMKFRDWALANGYKDNLTIDRIDNDGSYSPENCRWITYKEQCRNKRNTRIIVYNGTEYHTIKDLCIKLGMSYRLVQSRIRNGWPIDQAVSRFKFKTGPRKSGQTRIERVKSKQ